ncbi:MAG: hypothetical protein JWN44_1482 [Myxococcales bacterium]|nr:hypothetical protein [Myxococcales bacterium]
MVDASDGTLSERALAALAVVLAAVAGYVDALGWDLLSHVFVANMSGNTIALGRGVAQRDLGEAAARLWPIVTFGLGVFTSEILYEAARRRGRRSGAGWTLGLEAGALAFALALPWPPATSTASVHYYLATGLLAVAMGLQNATLIRVGASSVYTTHVTGNLTRLAREAAHSLFWLIDRARGRASGRLSSQRSSRRVALMAAMWTAYAFGAALGFAAVEYWHRQSVAAAIVVLTALVALDAIRPVGGHEDSGEPSPIF